MRAEKKYVIGTLLGVIVFILIIIAFAKSPTIDFDLTKYSPNLRLGLLSTFNAMPEDVTDKTIKVEGVAVVATDEECHDEECNDPSHNHNENTDTESGSKEKKMLLVMSDSGTVGVEYEYDKDIETGAKIVAIGRFKNIDSRTVIHVDNIIIK